MDYLSDYKKAASIEAVVGERMFEIEPYPSKLVDGKVITNVADFYNEWKRAHPECAGRKIRLTIELVPTEAERQAARESEYFDNNFA